MTFSEIRQLMCYLLFQQIWKLKSNALSVKINQGPCGSTSFITTAACHVIKCLTTLPARGHYVIRRHHLPRHQMTHNIARPRALCHQTSPLATSSNASQHCPPAGIMSSHVTTCHVIKQLTTLPARGHYVIMHHHFQNKPLLLASQVHFSFVYFLNLRK